MAAVSLALTRDREGTSRCVTIAIRSNRSRRQFTIARASSDSWPPAVVRLQRVVQYGARREHWVTSALMFLGAYRRILVRDGLGPDIEDAKPVHAVEHTSHRIAPTPVTNEQYR